MNTKVSLKSSSGKTIALVAVVSVLFGVMVGMSVQITEAVEAGGLTDKRLGAKTPKSYGAATAGMVCGDQLCEGVQSTHGTAFDVEEHHEVEFISEHDDSTPVTKLINIQKFRESTNKNDAITFIITYSITAGNENLEDIRVHISSDVESLDYNIGSLSSLKSSKNVARIKQPRTVELAGRTSHGTRWLACKSTWRSG